MRQIKLQSTWDLADRPHLEAINRTYYNSLSQLPQVERNILRTYDTSATDVLLSPSPPRLTQTHGDCAEFVVLASLGVYLSSFHRKILATRSMATVLLHFQTAIIAEDPHRWVIDTHRLI